MNKTQNPYIIVIETGNDKIIISKDSDYSDLFDACLCLYDEVYVNLDEEKLLNQQYTTEELFGVIAKFYEAE